LNNIKQFKKELLQVFKDCTKQLPHKLNNYPTGTKIMIQEAGYRFYLHNSRTHVTLNVYLHVETTYFLSNGTLSCLNVPLLPGTTLRKFYDKHLQYFNITLKEIVESLTGVELFLDKYNELFYNKIEDTLNQDDIEEIIAAGRKLIEQYKRI